MAPVDVVDRAGVKVVDREGRQVVIDRSASPATDHIKFVNELLKTGEITSEDLQI